MTTIKPVELAPGVYMFRGSPATLAVIENGVAYVVDPGIPEKRGQLLRKALSKLGASEFEVLITHGHPDHIAAVNALRPRAVYATAPEALLAERFSARIAETFGYPLRKWREMLLFSAPEVRVTRVIGPDSQVGPLRAIPLPGHSWGQVGFEANGVVYLADALFGDRLLAKVGLPFIVDHRDAIESISRAVKVCRGLAVLSHGPSPLEPRELGEVARANRERIEWVVKRVGELLDEGLPADAMAVRLLRELGVEASPSSVLLGLPLVRSAIAEYVDRGLAAPAVGERVVWRREPL